ncbi:hypothetical protein O9992_09785 [Vibrio lentus]|nr:hypothetical protein [Vibrio lentus]
MARLADNKANADMSYELATIKLDVELEDTPGSLSLKHNQILMS